MAAARALVRCDHRDWIPEQIGLAANRMAEEALTNVVKHAKAGTVTIRLDSSHAGWLVSQCGTNGQGFCVESHPGGLGMGTMQNTLKLWMASVRSIAIQGVQRLRRCSRSRDMRRAGEFVIDYCPAYSRCPSHDRIQGCRANEVSSDHRLPDLDMRAPSPRLPNGWCGSSNRVGQKRPWAGWQIGFVLYISFSRRQTGRGRGLLE
jgi:hypothetical protein